MQSSTLCLCIKVKIMSTAYVLYQFRLQTTIPPHHIVHIDLASYEYSSTNTKTNMQNVIGQMGAEECDVFCVRHCGDSISKPFDSVVLNTDPF